MVLGAASPKCRATSVHTLGSEVKSVQHGMHQFQHIFIPSFFVGSLTTAKCSNYAAKNAVHTPILIRAIISTYPKSGLFKDCPGCTRVQNCSFCLIMNCIQLQLAILFGSFSCVWARSMSHRCVLGPFLYRTMSFRERKCSL